MVCVQGPMTARGHCVLFYYTQPCPLGAFIKWMEGWANGAVGRRGINMCTCALCVTCVCTQSLGRFRLFATPWTVAHQAPLSMGFSRQEYWSGLPCPPPEDLPDPGIEPRSPALQADSLPSEPPVVIRDGWGFPLHLGSGCVVHQNSMLSSNHTRTKSWPWPLLTSFGVPRCLWQILRGSPPTSAFSPASNVPGSTGSWVFTTPGCSPWH